MFAKCEREGFFMHRHNCGSEHNSHNPSLRGKPLKIKAKLFFEKKLAVAIADKANTNIAEKCVQFLFCEPAGLTNRLHCKS